MGAAQPHRHAAQGSASVLRASLQDLWVVAQRLRSSSLPACRRLGAELQAMLQEGSAETEAKSHSEAEASRAKGERPSPRSPWAAPRSMEALLEWDAWLEGPLGTPYAGGLFKLALSFPEAYPFQPPHAEFVTPCYHPNISDRGKICLNVLKEEWSPMLTVSSLLLCISALLSQPNAEDPLNVEAADTLARNPARFEQMAREWTKRHAVDNGSSAGGSGRRKVGPVTSQGPRDDPLATYQTTASGVVLDEDEALQQALQLSSAAGGQHGEATRRSDSQTHHRRHQRSAPIPGLGPGHPKVRLATS